MSLIQIIVLCLIEGITEFLPISSSGHLMVAPLLIGWRDQGTMADIMLHMGALAAIIAYFWRDVLNLLRGSLDLLRGHMTPWGRIALFLLLATLPAIIFGLFLDKIGFMEAVRSTPLVVAFNSIFFGVLLYICDQYGLKSRRLADMALLPALLIGLAQAIAIIPGTSRSGITITAARSLGFERSDAARFSFLLGIPAIAGAGVFKIGDAVATGTEIAPEMFLAAILTFFVSLATITLLMQLVRRISFLPFAIYRICFGLVLIVLIYSAVPLGVVN